MTNSRLQSSFSLPVFLSKDFKVHEGVNRGDVLSFASDVSLEDIYRWSHGASPVRLSLERSDNDEYRISENSATGEVGATVFLDSSLTFMCVDGTTTETLVLVEVDGDGNVAEVYALPLASFASDQRYTLVGIDKDNPQAKLAEIACVSFAAGTHITTATGEQRKIEDLKVGDMILTRDEGVKPLRWIGHTTVRSVGEFAPILIKAGTLNNENDLIVSPEHRLFVYQRSDELNAGRAELLVKARHLVNGVSVTSKNGGFVDYYQLLFDDHHIIYAEGIAAESLLADHRTRPALPKELAQKIAERLGAHDPSDRNALELSEPQLRHKNTVELLRRASVR